MKNIIKCKNTSLPIVILSKMYFLPNVKKTKAFFMCSKGQRVIVYSACNYFGTVYSNWSLFP